MYYTRPCKSFHFLSLALWLQKVAIKKKKKKSPIKVLGEFLSFFKSPRRGGIKLKRTTVGIVVVVQRTVSNEELIVEQQQQQQRCCLLWKSFDLIIRSLWKMQLIKRTRKRQKGGVVAAMTTAFKFPLSSSLATN